jgi:outer membrane protein OmpA-like peptidoglycan-associated protein
MKTGLPVVSVIVVALALVASPAFAQQPAAGRIKVASGSVDVVRAGTAHPAQAGQLVYESDTLRTGADGRLGITLNDDTRVSLGPSSEVRPDRFVCRPARASSLVLRVVRRGCVVAGLIARSPTPPAGDAGGHRRRPGHHRRDARHRVDMIRDRRRTTALSAAILAALTSACAPKTVKPADHRTESLTVLLPDSDTKAVGRASVSNAAGQTALQAERESSVAVIGQAPSAATVMDAAEVERIFGATLSALPPAPTHFMLFYKFDSDELTDESRALVPSILQAVKDRPVPDVLIIGHTDTTGTATSNYSLGLKRANAVRAMLIEAGLNGSFVETTSHGEADLLIQTADSVAEPRNRRVEITVR